MYIDNYKKHCYLILADFILDYKEQIFVTGIKANIKYLICHILPKKKRVNNPVIEIVNLSVKLKLA